VIKVIGQLGKPDWSAPTCNKSLQIQALIPWLPKQFELVVKGKSVDGVTLPCSALVKTSAISVPLTYEQWFALNKAYYSPAQLDVIQSKWKR